MDELNQFLSGVEARARQILLQQSRKARDRAVRARADELRAERLGRAPRPAAGTTAATATASRDELRARYASGGALVVVADAPQLPSPPPSPPSSPSKLPRLSPPRPGIPSPSPSPSPSRSPARAGTGGPPAALPALERPRKGRKAAVPTKLLASPLAKALGGGAAGGAGGNNVLRGADQVAALLRALGPAGPSANARATRPAHAVETRMCLACWGAADRATGCERHPREPPGPGPPVELQGPSSWDSGDLRAKFRAEPAREPLAALADGLRHPVVGAVAAQLERENLRALADSRRRNLAKAFELDVRRVWLSNLDHCADRGDRRGRRDQRDQRDQRDEDLRGEQHALRGRRDHAALRAGYAQIPSVSAARALAHAHARAAAGSSALPLLPPSSSPAAGTDPGPDARPSRRRPRRDRWTGGADADAAPLSLQVCGARERIDDVPGVALVGRAVEARDATGDATGDETRDEARDETRDDTGDEMVVAALFARDAARCATGALLVSVVAAIDSPALVPTLVAWHVGSTRPPPASASASLSPSSSPSPSPSPCVVPKRAAQLTGAATAPLVTRLDAVRPRALVLLNGASARADRRPGPARDADGFRLWLRLRAGRVLPPDSHADARAVSISAATANAPHVSGRHCWHEARPVPSALELSRPRTARDLVPMARNSRARGGSNDAALLAAVAAHERLRDVRWLGLRAAFVAARAERQRREEQRRAAREVERKLEAGKRLLEAKRSEQRRVADELQAAAARRRDQRDGRGPRDAGWDGGDGGGGGDEWAERVAQSQVEDVRGGWERRVLPRDDGVVFFRAVNELLPPRHRFRWDPPDGWSDMGDEGARDARDEDTGDDDTGDEDAGDDAETDAGGDGRDPGGEEDADAADIAGDLLRDERFLARLRDALGLPAAAGDGSTAPPARAHPPRLPLDGGDAAEPFADASPASPAAGARPGEGWRRLARAALPTGFARRALAPRVLGPRPASFVGQPNGAAPVGLLDPAQWSAHDAPELSPELRALFVPRAAADLDEKKARQLELLQEQQQEPQPQEQDPRRQRADGEDESVSAEQWAARAVLCARSGNLDGLASALDAGVAVDARDAHGNSLLVLACQQGNTRLAKLLLRRGAAMDLQNLGGNSALHYLRAYGHSALADYLTAKGADDSLRNAQGLTCYEGLDRGHLDAL